MKKKLVKKCGCKTTRPPSPLPTPRAPQAPQTPSHIHACALKRTLSSTARSPQPTRREASVPAPRRSPRASSERAHRWRAPRRAGAGRSGPCSPLLLRVCESLSMCNSPRPPEEPCTQGPRRPRPSPGTSRCPRDPRRLQRPIAAERHCASRADLPSSLPPAKQWNRLPRALGAHAPRPARPARAPKGRAHSTKSRDCTTQRQEEDPMRRDH